MTATATTTVYDLVTAKILEHLDAGTVPWRKPWTGGDGMPRSLSTGKPYRGVNPFLLACESMATGHASNWWGTYDQIAELAGMVKVGRRWVAKDGSDTTAGVKKGETATLIVFWKRTDKTAPNPITGQDEKRKLFILRYYKVFNLDQGHFPNGLPEKYQPAVDKPDAFDRIAEAERVAFNYFGRNNHGPELRHSDESAAWYRPSIDVVNIPPATSFSTAEGYYSTLFHEAGHSTGHGSRMARPNVLDGHAFGCDPYAQEELVAEFTAAFLCGSTGIPMDESIENSAAYIANWARQLKADPKLIVHAAAQAQRAADHVRHIEHSP